MQHDLAGAQNDHLTPHPTQLRKGVPRCETTAVDYGAGRILRPHLCLLNSNALIGKVPHQVGQRPARFDMRLVPEEKPVSMPAFQCGFKPGDIGAVDRIVPQGAAGKRIKIGPVAFGCEHQRAAFGYIGDLGPGRSSAAAMGDDDRRGQRALTVRCEHAAGPPRAAMRPGRAGPIDQARR